MRIKNDVPLRKTKSAMKDEICDGPCALLDTASGVSLQFLHMCLHTAAQSVQIISPFEHRDEPLLTAGRSNFLDDLRHAPISYFRDLHMRQRIGIVGIEAGGNEHAVWAVG